MLFVPAVPNDSIHIQSLTGSEKITFTAGIHLICCSFLCSFFWGGFCHPAILNGNIVPERVNLMAVYREGKKPLLLKKGKGEREKEGRKKRGKEGMRNHPSARRSPLSGHVFPLGTQGWRGCYASNRTLMAEALKKSR